MTRLPPPPKVAKAVLAYEKVGEHLESDKKFKKAVALLAQMLGTTLTEATSAAAFAAIKSAMGRDAGRAADPQFRRDVFDLVIAAAGHDKVLVKSGSVEEALLHSWKLAAITSNSLLNDDTFEFAKAAKVVMLTLQGFGEGAHAKDEEVTNHTGGALVTCLQLLQAKYSFAWAKTSVDLCYKVRHPPSTAWVGGRACITYI